MPFFSPLSDQELIPLAAACRPRHYRRDQIIFARGDPGDTFHIVQSGRVRIILSSPEGKEILLAVMQPGDFFGELSLLDGLSRSATAVASTPAVTLTLSRLEFLRILEHAPGLAHNIMLVLCARLRRTDILLGDSVFLDVPTRLVRRLRELALTHGEDRTATGAQAIRVTQRELTALVGASRESVSKGLWALVRKGLIQVDRGRIVLPHPEALDALAW
jgi:CRP/FNR family transcriptional regulator/CRP/FNR family cyclic AMP-dependent transcriptional regulator